MIERFSDLRSDDATGVKLSQQELRNAEFFGEFKSLMYELAVEQ